MDVQRRRRRELTNGTTKTFVRGGGGIAAAGVARNYSKYFGIRLDFQFDNLPLRTSALQAAQATGATNHVYSFTLDPIINIPVTSNWGGYIVVRPGVITIAPANLILPPPFLGRPAILFSCGGDTATTAACPSTASFCNESQNEFGYNFGGGDHPQDPAEHRFLRRVPIPARQAQRHHTDLRPITVGIRWYSRILREQPRWISR